MEQERQQSMMWSIAMKTWIDFQLFYLVNFNQLTYVIFTEINMNKIFLRKKENDRPNHFLGFGLVWEKTIQSSNYFIQYSYGMRCRIAANFD